MDLDNYISKLKSSSATPGGGSASAISSMFAASLNSMAALLSTGKKKLLAHDNYFKTIADESGSIIGELKNLSLEDEKTFQGIMDALHIDRNELDRADAINTAIKNSVRVSWKIAGISLHNMENSLFLCNNGNANLITDDISAAYMAYTAIHTSVNNIKINLKFQKDKNYKEAELLKLKFFMENVESIIESIRLKENSIIP
ncbi:cyclodeaminase/cyclohydrolase family protein [Ferroplasma sp.]|uniref:cyclodeaminase/cyclohydrolase family protein n=1 Tax=Ferroplasma sp. TaxID=2591003 RepID=UPI00307D3406